LPAGLIRISLAVLLPMAALAGCGGTADTGARNTSGAGPAPVDLGTAGDLASAAGYVILAKTAVTNVPTSAVTGNIGLSPAAGSFLTGFSSSLPAGGAGVVEIALTFALHWMGLPFVRALLGVVVYRLFNLWLPIVPALAVMPPIDELRRDFDAADQAVEEAR
jgi:hypothetical protein